MTICYPLDTGWRPSIGSDNPIFLKIIPKIFALIQTFVAFTNCLKIAFILTAYLGTPCRFLLGDLGLEDEISLHMFPMVLCFYYGVLREISPDVETLVRVHIIPSKIESSNGRTFDVIENNRAIELKPTMSYTTMTPLAAQPLEASRGSCSAGLKAQLVIEEGVERLNIYCRISAAEQNMFCTFTPLQLMAKVLDASGLVQCNRTGCKELSNPNIGAVTVAGEGQLNPLKRAEQGYSVILRQVAGSSLGRYIALFLDVSDLENQVGMVLQNDECFPCCIRAALDLHKNHRVVCIVQK